VNGLALRNDGTVWAWGYNGWGGCGDGLEGDARPTVRIRAAQVTHLSGVVAIAAGAGHCLALRADGTVWAWGFNDCGQLGDSFTASRSTPAQVRGLGDVVAIAGGRAHSLALAADDNVWSWGGNAMGQLGDGTTTGRLAPVPVGGMPGVMAIAAGEQHSVALTRQESAADPHQGYRRQYRPRTEGLFARITHHRYHNNDYWEVRSKDGQVSLYGTPHAAGTDLAVVANPSDPRKVFAWKLTRTADVCGNRIQYEYVRDAGSDAFHNWNQSYLHRIRYVDYGAEGETRYLVSVTFFYADRPDPFSDYRAGFEVRTTKRCTRIEVRTHADQERVVHAYNLTYLDERPDPAQPPLNGASLLSQIEMTSEGGNLGWTWGADVSARLSSPAPVREFTDAKSIAAGNGYNLGLAPDGSVWAWGLNGGGALGDGTRNDRYTPAPVLGLSAVAGVSAGWDHSLAVKADGTVWTWGDNSYGQLGLGNTEPQLTPVRVPSFDKVIAVAAGKLYSLALREDGTVWSWGYGMALGDGVGTTRLTPGPVAGLSGVTAIAAGGSNGLALRSDGTVWAWGYNAWGGCGDGLGDNVRPTVRLTPMQVTRLGAAVAIAAGGGHCLALREDGTVWAWGLNDGSALPATGGGQRGVQERRQGPKPGGGAALPGQRRFFRVDAGVSSGIP
jgi:alpha-tubulin suppressor-like RCC1 family protein